MQAVRPCSEYLRYQEIQQCRHLMSLTTRSSAFCSNQPLLFLQRWSLSTSTFFSPQTQQALTPPTASATSIFLHIQSQLFTRIDLDQVQPNLARFIERLELDEPSGEEGEWVMMAVLTIGSLLEFGKPDSVI